MTPPLAPGTTLVEGRYILREVLGQGGFGITYRAMDTLLERPVAIKELFPTGCTRTGNSVVLAGGLEGGPDAFAIAKERFLAEARTLAGFRHPGIVRVHEVFEENNTAYMVMEHLEGRTLARILDEHEGPIPEGRALEYAAQIADALSSVHEAGLLHRDVKPANVIRTVEGNLVLIDFGTARTFHARRSTTVTAMVTPGYAPPEQYSTDAGTSRSLGPPTDVYALSATVYHLVTGTPPPSAPDRAGGTPLQPPDRLNSAVGRATSQAVMTGLRLDPKERPQSVAAFLGHLPDRISATERQPEVTPTVRTGDAVTKPASVGAPTEVHPPKYRRRSWAARGPLMLLILTSALVAAAAGVLFFELMDESASGGAQTGGASPETATQAPGREATPESTERRPLYQEVPTGPFWTTIAASVPRERGGVQRADEVARALERQGFEAGILYSSNFSSLNPGYWVVYTGEFPSRSAALAQAERVRRAGYEDAYARQVVP